MAAPCAGCSAAVLPGKVCTPIKVDFLQIGAVIAGGLQAIQRELGGDVVCRDLAAARAGAASLEQVVGQEAHVRADALRIDPLHRGHDITRKSELRSPRALST